MWDNANDAFSISQTAYASIVAGSAGRTGRHGIVVSSSKHIWLESMGFKLNEVENTCGVAIRDNTRDILVEKVKIEYPTLAGICARNSSAILVKDGAIYNIPGDENAACYQVRTITGFHADDNSCVVNDGQVYDTDGSVVPPTAVPAPVSGPILFHFPLE